TLIGRLLHDTKSLFEDTWEAVEQASRSRGDEEIDLALVTDGLRAEREQKITIDVAYRYFSTPRRKFIIADTPGHEQYTRNMVTGASTAELAVLLVDARKGITTQTRRHAFISTLLGIPHLLVAVNKMDLLDFDQSIFNTITEEFQAFASRLEAANVTYIPISALRGDNVAHRSQNTPWYDGPTLLNFLERVSVGVSRNIVDFRFPVQTVLRPNQDFRGFAGQVSSGRIRPGDDVVELPTGQRTRVKSIMTYDGPLEEAVAGDSVVLTLQDEVDLSRGSMLVRTRNLPQVGAHLDVTLCWLSEQPMKLGSPYRLMHTTREVRCYVEELNYQIDVNSMHRIDSQTLHLNEIGRAQLVATAPIFFDHYRTNRATGNFVLVDLDTNSTVAAGMIRGAFASIEDVTPHRAQRATNVVYQAGAVPLHDREQQHGHRAAVLWFTGLSGSGKSTISRALERRLFEQGRSTMFLDGDNLRHGLCSDLGFSPEDRSENIRRVAEVARLAYLHGQVVLCSLISPFAADRDFARSLVPQGRFFEIHVDCDVDTCRGRDPKGLYKLVDQNIIQEFTGVSSPYEPPGQPELRLDTRELTVEQAVDRILALLAEAL
ncbi:MAG: adenylyl-sulfate kinase, partial [Candidatus Eremiobacteraeota bacterium]|nr:adenylyl-sulfate kinase [Candidatus Eremiobacteraeota bacterium]